MSPVRFKVVTDDGHDTRDPTNDELPHIVAYVGQFVRELGVEPMATHEVPGVATLVWFQHIDN